MDLTKIGVTRLNSRNYRSWAFKLEMLMNREGTWKHVQSAAAPRDATAAEQTAWTEGDAKARAVIALMVEDNQHNLIMGKTSAKAMWDALKAHHHKATLTGKVGLLKEICNASYTMGESMEEFLYGMEDLFSKLENSGEKLSGYMQVAMLLRSLPKEFDTLTTALESRTDKDLTMDLVRSKLIDESEKLNGGKLQAERVLKVNGEAAGSANCWSCGKPGHKQRKCKEFTAAKKSDKKNTKKPEQRNKKVRESDYKSYTFMVRRNQNRIPARSWLIDSGATSHMCCVRSFFKTFRPETNSSVVVADGTEKRVEGVGTGVLYCVDGSNNTIELTLQNVLYVPTLEGSMLSVSKLTSKGVKVNFDNFHCELEYEKSVIAIGDLKNDMFWLRMSQARVSAVKEKQHTKNCQHTWHRRFGHRDPEAVGQMQREELASGLNVVDCGIQLTCESCVEAKMARLPFPRSAEKVSTSVLDVVHTDVCGPMRQTTPSGYRFYVLMIDDYSRFTYVYFLHRKSEVETRIREYVRMVETHFGRKPRAIRSDQGGEYSGKSLRQFYVDEGIRPQYTAAYSPQQNGVSERKNRSLCEMARCMLLEAGLHQHFWAEAVNTACYLQNRLPTAAVKRTPYEAWFGRKPDVSNLRPFGCSAYVLVPAVKRSKFDASSTKMIFLGYSGEHKAYRMLDAKTGKIVISRDVRFMELDNVRSQADTAVTGDSEVMFDVASSTGVVPEEVLSEEEYHDTTSEFEGFDDGENDVPIDDPEPPEGGDSDDDPQPVRHSERTTAGVPPDRYTPRTNAVRQQVTEPKTYNEAVASPHRADWESAMKDEMQSHYENGTWELAELPPNHRAIGCKWIYKYKTNEDGQLVRYKARLVALGYNQKYGTEYDLVFAPVVKQATFRLMLSIAGRRSMLAKHVDIKTAYLYGQLAEEIYMRQPPGYESGDRKLVCRLKRSLYGLKQAARVWNKTIDEVLKQMGFVPSKADPCLYVRLTGEKYAYVLIYVDDVIVLCSTEQEFTIIVKGLRARFKLSVMGNLTFFLGIQVRLEDGRFRINQRAYLRRLLEQFGMMNAKPSKVPMDPNFLQQKEEMSTPLESTEKYQRLIGALLYTAVTSRPDIAIATSILGRRVQHPTEADWTEAKRVLRYLRGTLNTELCLGYDGSDLECFVDADWAGDVSDRKSNSGYIFKIGGGVLAWGCHKQTCVALSSTEAEYVALAECLRELKWICKLLEDIGEPAHTPIAVKEDNQSCIALTQDDRAEKKSKHIDTKYNFVKDMVRQGTVRLEYCPTDIMEADLLTKPLSAVKLKQHREALGIRTYSAEEEC